MAVIVVVTLAVAGCGTGGGGTVKAVTAADAPALAGVWQGYMLSTQGTSYPATLTVKPDGTYVVQGGALRGEGRAEPRDGHVQFVSTSTTGGMSVGERTGSAVLLDRGSAWGLVGQGRSSGGPFNFDFNKPK